MKTPKSDVKRIIVLDDGCTKPMYRFLAPMAGFEYKTFGQAIKKAKAEIDAGYPTVLGALDLYHLPYYPKPYQKVHVPLRFDDRLR